MSKLFELKEWHSLEYSANYLTKKLNESFLPSDILRMAIEGRITMSVYFIGHVSARGGEITSKGQLKSGDLSLESGEMLIFKDELIHIKGIYDLPMIGGEILDCEDKIQELDGGPVVLDSDYRGAFVRDFKSGIYYQILEYNEGDIGAFEHLGPEYEMSGLSYKGRLFSPDFLNPRYNINSKLARENVFVVRTSVLQDFIDSQMVLETNKVVPEVDKPLMKRERDTLLTIIAALAKAAKINIDYKKPGKSSVFISGLTDQINAHVSIRAIVTHLEKIPKALESRLE